ncbi:TonB-dependent siderophore receptor [Hyphomicrobium sp.]|uniref:TonB-dependent receptor n=1 Tax=Hyphomicrobium sp. TaxID=82 RepID=UPI0025B84289|nr:TonB-dependent siderophore receptor [Hyphomicrobium sp.]
MASIVLATGASAQQAAEPAAELPPLEVTAKKAAKKKTVAKKAAQPATSPVPMAPEPEPSTASPQDTTGAFTPESGNTLQSGTGLGRLQGNYQSTPQIVNVISQERIREQNLTTVDQALRAVPGVTVSIGEGNGGMNGDQFRIRGFDAKGDLYVDGLRDFGVYVRDSFAYEQVDVLKGPTSESFGMGTTGGVVNLRQKTAHLGDAASAEVTVGTDSFVRSIIDVNKQINETTAARAVGMYHDQDFADRDHSTAERWGFLGSLGFGLGTDTELTINYLHQNNDHMPDFGVPVVIAPGAAAGLPVTEFGVPRSNYYGKPTDKDESTVDMLTARLSTNVNPWLTIQNDTRFEFFDRDFSSTPASCARGTPTSCNELFFSTGDATYAFGGGGGVSYEQESWGFQNITTAIAKFNTGFLRHEAVAGFDFFYQDDERLGKSYVGSKDAGTILNPDYSVDYSIVDNPNNQKKSDAVNYAFFASDRVWLTPEFSLLGGIRWDSYTANYSYTTTSTGAWNPELTSETEFWSPKLSAIWEPTKAQTYYVSWATSATPAGQFITSGVNPIGTSPGQDNLEPEENESYEIGAKYSLLGGRLGLSAAAFRVDKSNAYYSPDGVTIVQSGEEQRVQGVELGLNGLITDKWTVAIAYAYFDSEITYANDASLIGNHVPNVPENSASIWTTYDIASLVNVPGKLLVGGGVTYAQDMYIRSDEANKVPESVVVDGLISYEVDRYRFAVNGYNLTDELYYDSSFQGSTASASRATPAPGRSFTFTAGIKF